jgi:hypothetical protein
MLKTIIFSIFFGLLCTVANQAVSRLAKYSLLQLPLPSEPLPFYTRAVIGSSGWFTLAVWILIFVILYKMHAAKLCRSFLIVALIELFWLILLVNAAMLPLVGVPFKMK